MPQNSRHGAFGEAAKIWRKNRDAIAGEEAMKQNSGTYIPKLPGQPQARYDAYIQRARYVNYVGKIHDISINQVFRKAPILTDFPEEWADDIDLCGRSVSSFSKEILSEILKVNRVGVVVDYSESLKRPYLVPFTAEQIINWQTEIVDGAEALTRVVIEGEMTVDSGDPYMPKTEKIWREYVIEDGVYVVKVWKKGKDDKFTSTDEPVPPLFVGKQMTFIPFYLLSASGISIQPTKGPFSDLVNINIGHFQNSADYENRLHVTGAVTLVTRGAMADKEPPIGGCIKFNGADGDAKFLEASTDSGLEQAMQRKAEALAQLGSSIISGKGRYVASAETQRLSSEGEYAALSDIAVTLSESMTKILRVMCEWGKRPSENVSIAYNNDFESSAPDPQELQVLFSGMLGGGWSFNTFFHNLKTREFYPEGHTAEDELKEITATQKMLADIRKANMDKTLTEVYGATGGRTADEK